MKVVCDLCKKEVEPENGIYIELIVKTRHGYNGSIDKSLDLDVCKDCIGQLKSLKLLLEVK